MTTTYEKAADVPPVPPDEDHERSDGPGPRRVTVNLTALSVRALMLIVRLTGVNQTDAINKALQFYAELKQVTDNGGAVYVRESGAQEAERIRIF